MHFSFLKQKKAENSLHTVVFYNLENLFDTIDDPETLDDHFTPKGEKKWTNKRYGKKVNKLAKTIAKVGNGSGDNPPVLVGVAEVENKKVVKDLIQSGPLKKIDYRYVHFDSPDERGIDTALIYHKDYFEVLFSEAITLWIHESDGTRDTTRDILHVHGKLNGEEVHVFVNHWPSRREGEEETEFKRIKAAETLLEYMDAINRKYPGANYIIMGDFNGGPFSEAIQRLMENDSLYNPTETLVDPHRGSANYNANWSNFDQIILSHSFLNYEKGTHSFVEANIYDDRSLKEWEGKYKGNPYRTYVGRRYLGGYSDHFPVYVRFKYNTG